MTNAKATIAVQIYRNANGDQRAGIEIANGPDRAAMGMAPREARSVASALVDAAQRISVPQPASDSPEATVGAPPPGQASAWALDRARHLAQGEHVETLARVMDEIRAEALGQASAMLRANPATSAAEILALGPEDGEDFQLAPKLPISLERSVFDELERCSKVMSRLIQRAPQYRRQIAYAILGNAIAYADSFGADAEGFLRVLRREAARPAELLPPKGGVA